MSDLPEIPPGEPGISQERAEDLAIWYADNHQESDDPAPRKRKMKWTVHRTEDTGDCFKVYLAYRPSRMFFSTPGAEMFVVSKSGQVHGRELIRPYNSTLLSTSAVLLAASVAILAVAGIWLTNSGQISNAQPPSATTHGLAVAVAPGHGAHLVSPRGVVRVDIAPGPLSTTGELTFRRVSPLSVTPFPQGVVPTSKVFDLSIADSAHSAGMQLSLLRPVVLTMALNQEELEIAISNPDRIAIYHLGGADREWEPLPTVVDLEAKTAQALADSLSTFALVISAIPASAETVLQSTQAHSPAKPFPKPATDSLDAEVKAFLDLSRPSLVPHDQPRETDRPGLAPLVSEPTASPLPDSQQNPTTSPAESANSTATPTPSPTPTRVSVPTASPVPRPEPIPVKEWELTSVQVFGSSVRVLVKAANLRFPSVSLNAVESSETYVSPSTQEHVFRRVLPGEHRLRAWTPGVPSHEETRAVLVSQPTPTPVPPPTVTPAPRYRLHINGEPVSPRHLLIWTENATLSLSNAPGYDGRYAVGTEVTIVASPKPGFLASWGGVDSQTGGYGSVMMVADRHVSLEIGLPSPTPAAPNIDQDTLTPFPTATAAPTGKPTATPKSTKIRPRRSTPAPTATPIPTPLPTPLTTNPHGDSLVASDKDGDFEIYVVDAGRTSWTRLTDNDKNDVDPAWSHDWEKVVFATDRTGNWEIFVMDRNGNGDNPLTHNPRDDRSPAWSRDGNEIVFETNRNGKWETWIMCAEGSLKRPVDTPLRIPRCS